MRAQALLDDDYYASDVAFVGLKGSIDVVLGPYEVDDDAWFGAKTAYEASIALVNEPATQRIGRIAAHLQELEDHLPLTPNLRGRKLGAAAPILVLDLIYHGGLAGAGGAAAGYGLPNDLRVLDAVGARTGTYSNILKLRYDSTFRPMAEAVLTDPDRSTLRFEDIRDEIMFVRIFDSLGPQFVTGTKQPIAEALRENAGVANQIRSMLLSLWGHRYLTEHGYLDRRETASLYSAFLIPALARARGSLASTPSQGSTYVLNPMVERYSQEDAWKELSGSLLHVHGRALSQTQYVSDSFARSISTMLELSCTRSKTISVPSGETSKSPITKLDWQIGELALGPGLRIQLPKILVGVPAPKDDQRPGVARERGVRAPVVRIRPGMPYGLPSGAEARSGNSCHSAPE